MMTLCLLASTGLSAQEELLEVSGVITDEQSGEPLIGVNVLHSSGGGTVTDAQGRYRLKILPPYTLILRYIGYEERKIALDTTAAKSLNANYTLSPSTTLLDQVVVTAGRFEQRQSEVTVSMEVLRPDLLEAKVVTSLEQALQETPGMIIVDSEPQIRSGSGYSFGAGSRVQILVDGIPQLSGDAGRPVWGNLPLETVEQIEVIKGASSVLYGSAALSGVINIRTTFPREAPMTKVTTYVGGYSAPRNDSAHYWSGLNTLRGQQVTHTERLGKKKNVGLVVGLIALSDDGHLGPILDSLGAPRYTTTLTTPSHNQVDRRIRANIGLRVKDQRIDGLQYGVNVNLNKSNSVSALLWENTGAGFYQAAAGAATTTRQEASNINPYLEYYGQKGDRIVLRGNWQQLNNDNDNDQSNFSDTYFTEGQYQFDLDRWGLKSTKVTAGISRLWATTDSPLFSNGGTDFTHDSSNEAAYLQVDSKLADRLNLSAGMRFERFEIDGVGESKPVFRAGANYQVGEATYFRGSVGQGFRFPTIGEQFLTTNVGVVAIYPNEDLRSETSTNIELGVKQGLKVGGFQGYADIAVFEQSFEDYIEFTFGQWADTASFDNLLGLGFRSLNTGRARVRGVEFSLAGRGSLGEKTSLSILGGYTYTSPMTLDPDLIYGRSTTVGQQLADLSETTYASTSSDGSEGILKYRMQHIARLNVDLTVGRISIGGGVRYNSFVENIDKVFIQLDEDPVLGGILPSGIGQYRRDNDGGDHVYDARISFQGNEVYRIGLVVNNLLHREYTIRPLDLEPTRHFILKMDITI